MKFLFVEVKQNNDKFVALFRSEDQTRDVYIVASYATNFAQFTAGQSFITITEQV